MNLDDTIVALSTPPGRGGLGVVRLSGPEAKPIATWMLRSQPNGDQEPNLEPARAHFVLLVEPMTGERIDEVVATYFAKPRSYTTDDVVEISCHGSPVVLRHVVELAVAAGARLAEPGEFTMRAFLRGRIDLTQAEAVRDLIDSQTLYQAKVAARQLEGALSHRLRPLKQQLVELIALLEAGIDFAEDDVTVLPGEEILRKLEEVRAPLAKLSASFAFGRLVHQGLTLAIVGRPNVGKSSLFNCLVERERAIVTATPGTTRDLVSETVAIGGIPVRLVDTAGIRQALDEAESIGIRKSLEALADADLLLVVLDASHTPEPAGKPSGSPSNILELDGVEDHGDCELLAMTAGRDPLVVLNKCDLVRDHASEVDIAGPLLRTSAVTGEGIAELRAEILRRIGCEKVAEQETGLLTNLRQQEQVKRALTALEAAARSTTDKIPHEMILLDLYGALSALDELTGATTADDILNLIFGTFCIGK